MITRFKEDKQNPILVCIVDNRKLYTSGWATEVSINVSDFLVHRFAVTGYDVFIGESEDELLAAAQGYSHAVVVAMGTSLNLSDRIFPAIENLCKQDFFVAGHVLHRNENSYYKNSYYELHHQFYVVNVAEYFELGCPVIGQQTEEQHVQLEPLRSPGYLYNDHEVAEWIKPGTEQRTYERKMHGWNIISVALANNRTLMDLGSDIRDNKKYVYYEYDHVFMREVSNLYWNQFFCNNFFASWNSDGLKDDFVFQGAIEQYVTVGIGVYWIHNLHKLNAAAGTRVVFTDINYNCLMFMKKMVEEWDGINYADFYRKHVPIMPNNTMKSIDPYVEWTATQWDEFVSKFDDWPNVWNHIRSLEFDYVLIDYMSAYNLNWVKPGLRTLVNMSDVFTHSPYTATQSLKYRVACENRLINSLKQVDPNIVLLMTSRAADGYHPADPRMMYSAVQDFDLTDINELKRPPWHTTDWTSPRILN